MVELASFHRGFVEVAKRLDTYHLPYRSALAYPTAHRLPIIRVPTLIAAHPDDPLQTHSPEAASLVPDARWDTVPNDLTDAAALYEEFLRLGVNAKSIAQGTAVDLGAARLSFSRF